MKEIYLGWDINTDHSHNTHGYAGRWFSFGKNLGWLVAEIIYSDNKWWLQTVSSVPFRFQPNKKYELSTQIDDCHALVHEANEVLHTYFTEAIDYLNSMLKELT